MRFRISGNPTTGYEWKLNEDATNGVFSVTKTFVRDDAPADYMGVGGTYVYDVEAG